MSAKKKKTAERDQEIRNKQAHREYHLSDNLEAGLVLKGTEVKSIRNGKAQIKDAFVRPDKGELWLYHAHIDEYAFGNVNNHNPVRPRKLLLNKRELRKYISAVEQGGYTIIPIRIYFKRSLAKVEIALAKGKKLYDKREDMKSRTARREADRAVSNAMKR